MQAELLIRHGVSRHLGRFRADPIAQDLLRGRAVVVLGARGFELGEVVGPSPSEGSVPGRVDGRVVRVAGSADREASRIAELARPDYLAVCLAVFRAGTWPIDLIDVEVLPAIEDQRPRAVLHYLGPHGLDDAGLRAHFRQMHDLEIILEPVGLDAVLDPDPEPEPESGCGSGGCGSGGCGSGTGGCDGCAVKALTRRPAAVPV